MSKKFEYELMLRLEKAEKAIASLASKIEKDLGKAVETAFRGASEFDVVKFSKNIGSRIEQDVSSALKQAFSGSSEFDFSKRVASSVEQDVKAALQSAFSGSSEFDFVDPSKAKQAEEEASRKRIEGIKNSSQTRNAVEDADHQRELQRIEGEDAARKKADADALKRVQDQQAAEAAHDADVYQRRQDEANIEAEKQKTHDENQEKYENLWGTQKKDHVDRIAQIRESTKAEQAAQAIRYQQHHTVLEVIQQAHLKNAEDLISIEQRITTMTEAEAKQQLIAYQKTAKARVDYAIEQGYKLEAIEARNSANGARSVSAIFQVQQAIEDSMYAGLRGAGNNIAMLLTSISSSWVAIGGLIGVATLQLASHLGVFEKLNEAMDGALWKTKEQVRQEEYLARIRREDWERRQKQPIEAVDFDPRGKSVESAQEDTAAAEKKLAILKEQQEALQFSIATFERLKDKANEIEAAYGTRDTANLGRLVREYIEIKAAFDAGNTGLDVKSAGMFEAMFGDGLKLSGGGLDELKKRWEDAGSAVAEAADKLAVYREEEERVLEVSQRRQDQEFLKEQATKVIEKEIDAAKLLVNTREDELRSIQKALEASQRSLEVEERRADAIRKASSAREDEVAQQELSLKNTILDMEASEKAKIAKDKAGSEEAKIKSQLDRAKQWAEQQAKIDKFNNPKNGANIAAAKDWWINNQEQQAQAALDRIKKTEQAEIESAKKIAEEAKKTNLDAMEAIQRQKAEQLKADAQQMLGQGRFGDAQEALDKAQKTLKEIADAEVSNLGQKDSLKQGEDSLKEWQRLQKQIKEVEDQKLAISEKAQEAEKQEILVQKALEDQAAARLESATAGHDLLLQKKKEIAEQSLFNPKDESSVLWMEMALGRILDLKQQISSVPLNGAGTPIQGPMPLPGTSGTGSGGSTMPGMPTAPGTQFNMSFSMNNATPNSVAAAANSIVQSQKAMAMLSGV